MNVFVVNTPFQLYVVKQIILQYFPFDKNIILSTIKGGNRKEKDVLFISPGILGLLKSNRFLRKIRTNISEVSFFVPHLGNLFSSYFFDLAKEFGRPISVYYEGVALLYDPVIANKKAYYKRFLQGLLLGIKYNHYEQLYPQSLLDIVECCYSPTTKMLDKYKQVKKIEFCSQNTSGDNNILFLTSDVVTSIEIEECIRFVQEYCKVGDSTLFIKPHYALNGMMLNNFVDRFKSLAIKDIVVLDKSTPIEQYYEDYSFNRIVCQRFTSAIVNAKFILGDNVQCYVINKKTLPIEMLKELDIQIA